MLETLATIFDKGDQFAGVSYVLFDADPNFIVAIQLHFESSLASFRANPDDDTLSVTVGAIELDADETFVDASRSELWSSFKGARLSWGWRLTNHQGYDDGVRLEFMGSERIVEFVVMASGIQIFSSTRQISR